ncbi:MAG: transposase, partial [Prevotellaceae bacterium]|nr:transposase [Prevotellaceae bacterium]
MNRNKYVFAQLVEFLNYDKFFHIVQKYDGDKGNRCFTCWNQLLMMLFGQLSNRESLMDLVTIVQAHKAKAYHMGFGSAVNVSTMARANASRNYKIFEEFAMYMIAYARRVSADAAFEVNTGGNIYAFDSSIISLCLSVFWWTTYKRDAGAVKLHTLLDVKTQIPCFMLVTPASVNDIKAMAY